MFRCNETDNDNSNNNKSNNKKYNNNGAAAQENPFITETKTTLYPETRTFMTHPTNSLANAGKAHPPYPSNRKKKTTRKQLTNNFVKFYANRRTEKMIWCGGWKRVRDWDSGSPTHNFRRGIYKNIT